MYKFFIITFSTFFIALSSFAQSDFEFDKKNPVKNEIVWVKKVAETTYLLTNQDGTSRYSCDIPEDFKKDGLKVSICGYIGKIPPYVRMMGTPFKLTKITAKDSRKKFAYSKRTYRFNPDFAVISKHSKIYAAKFEFND